MRNKTNNNKTNATYETHYENTYIEQFTSKNWNFSEKNNSDIFHASPQNIDCGYSLEPPRRGGSNEYP